MSTKLHEILAVAADREKAAVAITDETLATLTKRADHFMGKHTKYTPFDSEALDATENSKEMVTTVADKLKHCFSILGKSLDVHASIDATNQYAKADITVDGTTLATGVPATTLLMLETKLKKWIEILLAVPTLAPGRNWVLDPNRGVGVYVDQNPENKFRTKKVTKPIVLYEATKEHPAQVKESSEDVNIGKITETEWSGMLTPGEKAKLISRAQELLVEVKKARQRANSQDVQQVSIADVLIKHILG